MSNLFSLASNDQSYIYLTQIFGTVGPVLEPNNNNAAAAALSAIFPNLSSGMPVQTVIGQMFQTLNTTALTVGAILIVYVTVVGLLKTAQEGEFLGRQWNSLWVPIRMVMGIMCLFPSGAGYSVIQIVVMWVIVQGIGAADTLWTTVLQYVQQFGSPYAGVQIPTTVGIDNDLQNLFKALMCETAAASRDTNGNIYSSSTITNPITNTTVITNTYPDPNNPGSTKNYYYCMDYPSEPFCKTYIPLATILKTPSDYTSGSNAFCSTGIDANNSPTVTCNIGPSGVCGNITIGDYTTLSKTLSCPGTTLATTIQCASFQAQSQVVPNIVATMELIATQANQMDNEYIEFYNQSSSDKPATADSQFPFMQHYCAAAGALGSPGANGSPGCCVYDIQNSLSAFPLLSTASAMQVVTQARTSDGLAHCAIQDLKSPLFPSSNGWQASNTVVDYTNMNDDVAKKIIWPCGLGSTVANQSNCLAGGKNDAANFLASSVSNYTTFINTQVSGAVTQWVAAHPQPLSGWLQEAQGLGWIMAGAYYYEMAQQNSANLKAAIPSFAVNATAPSGPLAGYRNNYNVTANTLISLISGTGQSSLPSGVSSVGNFASSGGLGLTTVFISNMTTGANPLAAMQQEGEGLIITAYVIYSVTLFVMAVAIGFSDITFFGLGTGIATDPVWATLNFIGSWIMGLIMAFCAWAVAFGSMLAIYMPLVPYTIYIFAAVGWFLAVMEAMVASPFVALGILSPGGQHDILGKAEPAMMLIFNVFLRPSLMIMGMMLAMLLASVICNLINSTFVSVMTSVVGNTSIGPIESMVYISAYASLVMAALNKVFSLIYLLPERVLTWIGGQASSYGEAESVAQVKGAAEQMSSSVGGGVQSGMSQAGGKQSEIARQRTKGGGRKTSAKGTDNP